MIAVEDGKGEGIDISRYPEAEDEHQECRAEHREAEPDGVASQFQRFTDRAGDEPPQAGGYPTARLALNVRGACVRLVARNRLGRDDRTAQRRRLFEISDERVFESS